MFKEVLRIVTRLEGKDLNNMERQLSQRFGRVAKKFGGGLMAAIKGGGVLGLATTLIDKVLNPLKEVQEAVDKSLGSGDDLATYAEQFQTTAGNLARLQAFGQASGLDKEGVRLLLGKFQANVAQAAVSGKPSAVSNFVGRKDMAEAFFEFIQSMQKLDPTSKSLVQQEVFGEKQILKASEFLNADFNKLSSRFAKIGVPGTEELTAAAGALATKNDTRDIFRAAREMNDLVTKGRLINEGVLAQNIKGEQVDLDRENKRLGSYENLSKISKATDKMLYLLEDGYLKLAPALAQALPALISDIAGAVKIIEKSRAVRGMVPGKDN